MKDLKQGIVKNNIICWPIMGMAPGKNALFEQREEVVVMV